MSKIAQDLIHCKKLDFLNCLDWSIIGYMETLVKSPNWVKSNFQFIFQKCNFGKMVKSYAKPDQRVVISPNFSWCFFRVLVCFLWQLTYISCLWRNFCKISLQVDSFLESRFVFIAIVCFIWYITTGKYFFLLS